MAAASKLKDNHSGKGPGVAGVGTTGPTDALLTSYLRCMTILAGEHFLWSKLNSAAHLFANLDGFLVKEKLAVKMFKLRKTSQWINHCKKSYFALAIQRSKTVPNCKPEGLFKHLGEKLWTWKLIACPLWKNKISFKVRDIHLTGSMTVQKLKEDASALKDKSSVSSLQGIRDHMIALVKSLAKISVEVDEVTELTVMIGVLVAAIPQQSKPSAGNTALASKLGNNE